MFENIGRFFKKMVKTDQKELGSKDAAKERLHLVLMQDRANVSADFLELMKQEIIDVIKKYIIIDESAIDVRLTNQSNEDGTNGAPALYANIPIVNIKNDMIIEKVNELEVINAGKKVKEESLSRDDIANKNNGIKNEENKTIKNDDNKEKNIDDNKEEQPAIIENDSKEVENSNNVANDEKEEQNKLENVEQNKKDIDCNEDNEEEEDFDLTFDDLLKAAEEEDKNKEVKQENKGYTNKSKKKKRKNKR